MEHHRDRLRKFINHEFTFIVVFVLILLSVGFTILEYATPKSRPGLLDLYEYIEIFITLIFIVELSIRYYVSVSFRQFLDDCWLDILAILPIIRPLRILRILRLLRLIGWGVRARRLRKLTILGTVLAENLLVVLVLFVVVIAATIGIMAAEAHNTNLDTLPEALWWSVLTLMAGEPTLAEPATATGKFITMIVMMGGFTLFAMFTGVVSAFMLNRLHDDRRAADFVLKHLRDHYIICGWSRSVPSIIKELHASRETRKRDIVIVTEVIPPEFVYHSGFGYGDVRNWSENFRVMSVHGTHILSSSLRMKKCLRN